jgi:hypothetical protein
MTPRDPEQIANVIDTLRRLYAHAVAITGNRRAGMAIVQSALKRHPRNPSGIDLLTMRALLRDVTDTCRAVPGGKDVVPGFGADFARLTFEARACLSLRINFGLAFGEIAKILSLSCCRARKLYSESIAGLDPGLHGGASVSPPPGT